MHLGERVRARLRGHHLRLQHAAEHAQPAAGRVGGDVECPTESAGRDGARGRAAVCAGDLSGDGVGGAAEGFQAGAGEWGQAVSWGTVWAGDEYVRVLGSFRVARAEMGWGVWAECALRRLHFMRPVPLPYPAPLRRQR